MIVMVDFMIYLIVVLIAVQCITVPPQPPPPLTMGGRKKNQFITQIATTIVTQNENRINQSIPLIILSAEELSQVQQKHLFAHLSILLPHVFVVRADLQLTLSTTVILISL